MPQAQLPPHVRLMADDSLVSLAVPLSDSVFVTADRVWQYHETLTWQGQVLEVLARDFERDLIFVKIAGWGGDVASWTDQALAVGAEVYWGDGLNTHSGQMLSLGEDSKDWFLLESGDQPFLPGSPVFNTSGEVLGILLEENQTQGIFRGVRSDRILDFYEQIQ